MPVAEPSDLVPNPANQFPIPPFGPIFPIAPAFGIPLVRATVADLLLGPITQADPTSVAASAASLADPSSDPGASVVAAGSARSARKRPRQARP